MIGVRGCASACTPRSSAGTAAAVAAPACSTVRRLISRSPPVDRLAISPPQPFGTRASRFTEDCSLALVLVKATVLAQADTDRVAAQITEEIGQQPHHLKSV